MRKMMQKEVTKTTVKIAKVGMATNGLPTAEPLEDVVLIGNVNLENAQKQVGKMFDHPVTVFGVQPDTVIYEMKVEDFIKYASIKSDADGSEADASESESEAASA